MPVPGATDLDFLPVIGGAPGPQPVGKTQLGGAYRGTTHLDAAVGAVFCKSGEHGLCLRGHGLQVRHLDAAVAEP